MKSSIFFTTLIALFFCNAAHASKHDQINAIKQEYNEQIQRQKQRDRDCMRLAIPNTMLALTPQGTVCAFFMCACLCPTYLNCLNETCTECNNEEKNDQQIYLLVTQHLQGTKLRNHIKNNHTRDNPFDTMILKKLAEKPKSAKME